MVCLIDENKTHEKNLVSITFFGGRYEEKQPLDLQKKGLKKAFRKRRISRSLRTKPKIRTFAKTDEKRLFWPDSNPARNVQWLIGTTEITEKTRENRDLEAGKSEKGKK